MYMPPDDAKHNISWLALRKRRCLCLLLGSTFISLPIIFVLHGPGSLKLKTIALNWANSNKPFWPYQSASVEDIFFPPENPAYLLFEPPTAFPQVVSSSSLKTVVRPVRPLSSACLDAHFESGKPCAAAVPDPPLDVLWTWVNGSDRFLMDYMSQAVRRNDPRMSTTSRPNTELFRDHDELRHSVRSVLKHFRQSTDHLHILTSDFPFILPIVDNDTQVDSPRRLGLSPSWLDLTKTPSWQDGDITLSMAYHSQIIEDYQGVFNSYAIESQIKNMQGLSDNFVYMNDDFFMLTNLSKPDFYTSSYGTVLRMQADLQVNSDANPRVNPPSGEWGPLQYTNWCLSNRFGTRARPYLAHTAKSLSLALMNEFESIWQSQIEVTATHPFRGMTSGNRDIYSIFLFAHTLIERWREALLWSWVIGKIGPIDGGWGGNERDQAWMLLGGDVGHKNDDIVVRSTYRSSAQPEEIRRNLEESGHSLSGKTSYQFVSGDGYPYGFVQTHPKHMAYFPKFLSSPRPDEKGNSKGAELCKLSFSKCIGVPGKDFSTASDFFKFIAFEQVQCGDCVINALRAKSGESGLSAFLPPHDRFYKSIWDDEEEEEVALGGIDVEAIARMDASDYSRKSDVNDEDVSESETPTDSDSPSDADAESTSIPQYPLYSPPPHLPLISHYEEGDFSITEVLPTKGRINVRAWTLQLLQRYRFVLGDSPIRFNMITSLGDARNQMKNTDKDKNLALLCINDNIRGVTASQADVFLRDWQEKRWSDKADWEKQ